MKKTTSLVLLLPLGAGLLVAGSLVLDPPDAERRPAPSFAMSVNGRTVDLDDLADLQPSIDVTGALETIDIDFRRAVQHRKRRE